MYKAAGMKALIGETITRIEHGNEEMPTLNPYNGYTLFTASGKEFVVWNSFGETNLNEIIKEKT